MPQWRRGLKVRRRAASLGGDPKKVFVVGQSAGAPLAALALLRRMEAESHEGTACLLLGLSGMASAAPGAAPSPHNASRHDIWPGASAVAGGPSVAVAKAPPRAASS